MRVYIMVFSLLVVQITSLSAKVYETETINKNSFVTKVFGGIEQANEIRSFRDNVLLQSDEGQSYVEAFYRSLSSAAYVMVKDDYVRSETTKTLTTMISQIEYTINSSKIQKELITNVTYLLELYSKSRFSNKLLLEEIEIIKSKKPLLSFMKKFNENNLDSTNEIFVKYPKNTILVKFKPTVEKRYINENLQKYNLSVSKYYKELGVYKISLPEEYIDKIKEINGLLKTLNKDKYIEYAEPDYRLRTNRLPNDIDFNKLWGLDNEEQTGGIYDSDIDMPEAWNRITGSNVIVAVIDTGVDYNHEDLRTNMWVNHNEIPDNGIDDDRNGYIDDYRGWDFKNNDNDPLDDDGHGTHCSGTIGAVGNNGKGITGVNWKVKIMPLKFLDSCNGGSVSDAVDAIIYAGNMGAKIASNSWGGGSHSQTLYDAIKIFRSKGGLFIAASGNDGDNTDNNEHYPSSYSLDNIISVAATNHNDRLADFSNYGKISVDIAAPGDEIYSTIINNEYDTYSGTSMATPHVAGVAALIKGANNNLTYTQIKNILYRGVDKKSHLSNKLSTGGRLNAFKAIKNITKEKKWVPIIMNDIMIFVPSVEK